MKICVYGAGAGGGHLAVRLALAGHHVSVIARGAHLAAIQQRGLELRVGDTCLRAMVKAEGEPERLGPQDMLLVGVKATALRSVAANIAPLVRRDSIVVFPQNGMTWWYPHGLPPRHPNPPRIPIFELADDFLRLMRIDQVLGGVIYSANEIEAPGIIKNNSPHHNRLDVASIDNRDTAVAETVRGVLMQADILSPKPDDIREAVWTKLLANMSGSVIALATGDVSSACRSDPGLSEIYRRVVKEGLAIAAAHGFPLHHKISVDEMLARLLDHKPSLLQDYEESKPMEIGEIVLAPLAFARAQNIVTPSLDVLAAIAAKLATRKKLYPQASLNEMHLWDRFT